MLVVRIMLVVRVMSVVHIMLAVHIMLVVCKIRSEDKKICKSYSTGFEYF